MTTDIDNLRAALNVRNVRAFLAVIRAGEGTSDPDGYRRHFGGDLFTSFADHPRRVITAGSYTSSAAGAYQFLSRTWDECAKALALPDFGPASQDLACVFLVERRGALDDVVAGRLEDAVRNCNREWASLPGSPYGQPTRTMDQARAVFLAAGGMLAGAAEPAEQTPVTPEAIPPVQPPAEADASPPRKSIMAPLLAIAAQLLPTLAAAIPDLAKLIRPNSESAQHNAEIASKVFTVAQQAIGAVNAQDVVERVQADPTAAASVRKAVQERWFELSEIGGGGVVAARQADAAISGGDFLRSPSFWIALLMLPLVYLLVLSLIGLIGSAQWSDDVRAGLAGSLISAIVGGLIGYYYGQTTTRNRTPATP